MTKLQTDYDTHDSTNLDEGWAATREHVENALLIAFDGCHKIYLAMDEYEAKWFRDNYNGEGCDDQTFVGSPDQMFDTLTKWYEESCSLKFINAVWRNEADPNAGFVSLIDQGADDPRDEYEDDEDYDG